VGLGGISVEGCGRRFSLGVYSHISSDANLIRNANLSSRETPYR